MHVLQPTNTVGSLNVTGLILPFGPLTNSTLPTGLIAKFAPSLVEGNSTSTLTIQTSRSTLFSYYSLTVWLVSDSSKLNRDTQLIVKPARDEYTIFASPSMLLIAQGSSHTLHSRNSAGRTIATDTPMNIGKLTAPTLGHNHAETLSHNHAEIHSTTASKPITTA
jgi:hypothetical protein